MAKTTRDDNWPLPLVVIALCIMLNFVSTDVERDVSSHAKHMEEMIYSITNHTGIVVRESAMVWRACVLDYAADGFSAEEATYELLKKFEMGEWYPDSIMISNQRDHENY